MGTAESVSPNVRALANDSVAVSIGLDEAAESVDRELDGDCGEEDDEVLSALVAALLTSAVLLDFVAVVVVMKVVVGGLGVVEKVAADKLSGVVEELNVTADAELVVDAEDVVLELVDSENDDSGGARGG